MAEFLRYWLHWPSLDWFMAQPGAWAICETLHFLGLCLLIGFVGLFDLRVMGYAKGLAPGVLKRLLPWGVLGFGLCAATGGLFVLGIGANIIGGYAYDVIATNPYLQFKLVLIALGGVNLAAYYATGMSRAVDRVSPEGDAPLLAKFFAGASLAIWIGVIVFGRLIPQGL
jgi:hypothetical protein